MNEVERFVFLLSMLTFLSLSFPATVEGQFIQQNEVMDVSNLNVNDIAQDSVGYIWLATERGLDRLDGYQNHAYFDSNSSLSSSAMKKVYVNKSGVVYIFSALNDIYIYDRKVNNFIFIKNVSVDKWTTGITEDKSGTIWYGTGTGLYKIDAKSRTTHMVRIPLLMGPVADVEDSDNDLLWISMKNGKAYVYNYRQNKIVSVLKDGNFQQIVKGPWKNTLCGVQVSKIIVFNSLTDKEIKTIVPPDINPTIIKAGTTVDRRLYFLTNECRLYIYDKNNAITSNYVGLDDNSNTYITDILIDKASNIWIGTMADGYKFISSKQSIFDVDNVLSNYFHNDFVTYLTGNGADKIWVATYYEGLKEFDRKTKTLKNILQFKREKRTIVPDVSCCFCDSKKRLWATSSDAVYCFKTNPVTTLLKKYSLKDVRYITEDRRGNILIISNDNGAFWKLSPNSDRPVRPYPTLSYKANIAFVTQLHSGKYLFSSYGYGVCIGDDKGHYSMMYNGMDFKNELCCVIYIYEDFRGLIWMGTYHYGLLCYNPRTRQMRHFTVKNGLPSNDVLAITSDKEGDIWMSTSYGLSKYVGHGSFVDYFTNGNLLGNQYHERSVFSDKGVLYFTGNHGMTSFIPEKVKVRHNDIPFMIDYITTDKQTYYLLGLKDSETLKLSYKEGSFNVSFLGLDFASSNNLRYSYMLEGFDKTWSTPSSIRSVSYSNVTPGTYYLKAKVCDADGQWNNKILTLKIVVPAAPWASWWANIIYALIILFIVYWVLRVYNEYKLNQERAKLSEKTLAQERDLNQAKINFFENVSHELRTPLGLIYAPFCELLKIGSFTKRECEYMSLIGSNIDRLMVLIEQILSFAQLKSETMPLQVSKVDIVGIAWKVLSRFRGENEEKHIETSFSSTEEHIIMYVDEDKLDKILSNLLSNAYKYTPSRGNIVMSMRTVTADEVTRIFGNNDLIDTSYVLVSIKDSGIGIDKDEINKIFDRFYRSSKRKVSLEVGNGIGLYYIKCLVTKQKGLIKAERNVDKGSNFMFCLPMSDTSFSPSEIKGEQKGTEADAETLDYDTQISLSGSERGEA
jgi:signal transduction histidine kinase/ligand-binding sensor domain-containing protein